ncbi:hypothetical protein Nepgr_031341 [Nepenthes gracilis]|uniref:Uncharacterized protein n=1 Tax=Nepenthes gracilis TaxID=150966 RepID=A0AAD3TI89_NEPGR|nr:hypothetical protein Nepgr_031341 [Nepenthes gracilis]
MAALRSEATRPIASSGLPLCGILAGMMKANAMVVVPTGSAAAAAVWYQLIGNMMLADDCSRMMHDVNWNLSSQAGMYAVRQYGIQDASLGLADVELVTFSWSYYCRFTAESRKAFGPGCDQMLILCSVSAGLESMLKMLVCGLWPICFCLGLPDVELRPVLALMTWPVSGVVQEEPYPVVEVELADSRIRKGRSQSDAIPKQTGLKSSGTPAILSQVKLCEVLQSGYENAPDSDPLDVVSCSWDQAGLEPGLGLHLTVASPMSDSVNSVDAELAPAVGIPRIASCPAMLQLCNQQIAQLPVPSVGCNSPDPCLPIGPSFAEILCRGLDADSQGFLVGGVSCWPISEEDSIAALGPVGASSTLEPHPPGVTVPELEYALSLLPPVSERARGPVDHVVDLVNAPPSISRIITKYSLDTSYQLGHGSSSPNGLLAASSTDSHLDTPAVSYLGSQVAPSQQDSWQPVKSRRNRKSVSKDAKAAYAACSTVSSWGCFEDDGVPSGSMNDEHANVVITTDHPVLDVVAPCVGEHVAGSLPRPLTTLEAAPIEDDSRGAH